MPPKAATRVHEEYVAATFLMGRAIHKEFKGCGVFKGRVSDFHHNFGYRIEYEDGDTEDVTEVELVRDARA
jgi:hypothetical protein